MNKNPMINQRMLRNTILRFFATTVCYFCAFGSILAITCCDSRPTVPSEIKAVIDKFHNSILNHDERGLNSVIIPQIRFVTPFEDGYMNSTEVINRVSVLPGTLRSIDSKYIEFAIDDNIAYVDCLTTMELTSDTSESLYHKALYKFEILQENGVWKISSIQNK